MTFRTYLCQVRLEGEPAKSFDITFNRYNAAVDLYVSAMQSVHEILLLKCTLFSNHLTVLHGSENRTHPPPCPALMQLRSKAFSKEKQCKYFYALLLNTFFYGIRIITSHKIITFE